MARRVGRRRALALLGAAAAPLSGCAADLETPAIRDPGTTDVEGSGSSLSERCQRIEEDVEVAMVDNVAHLVYGPSVDDDTIQNVNRMLSFMGQLAVSMGDPAEGEWTPVPVDGAALSLSESTLSVPLSGEPVRALLETYDVPTSSGRYPLWVYVDGYHLGTRMVSSADLDGSRLVEPTTPITLDNRAEAAAMLAALRHPTRSIVEFGSLCDRFSESVPSG